MTVLARLPQRSAQAIEPEYLFKAACHFGPTNVHSCRSGESGSFPGGRTEAPSTTITETVSDGTLRPTDDRSTDRLASDVARRNSIPITEKAYVANGRKRREARQGSPAGFSKYEFMRTRNEGRSI